jgi:hypothetical protein
MQMQMQAWHASLVDAPVTTANMGHKGFGRQCLGNTIVGLKDASPLIHALQPLLTICSQMLLFREINEDRSCRSGIPYLFRTQEPQVRRSLWKPSHN